MRLVVPLNYKINENIANAPTKTERACLWEKYILRRSHNRRVYM